jgi:hypothetical protein
MGDRGIEMQPAMLVVLWIGAIASLIGAQVTRTMLVFKLREGRPDVYTKVGSPRAFSRKVEFLWSLKAYEDELGPHLRKLRKVSLAFGCLFVALVLIFVSIIIKGAFAGE